MKKLLLLLLCLPFIGFGQDNCGTIPTQQQIDYLSHTRNVRQNWNQSKSVLFLPIQNHIIRSTNGSGGLDVSYLQGIMDTLNSYYANSGIQFYSCGSTNFINNSSFYDFDADDEWLLCGPNDEQNVINIYYFNSITSSSGMDLCGYTYFPPSADRVIMDNSCATNNLTIVHELGHYLSLYHTHGTTNCGTTNELVNGLNCSYTGDDICDTPADPNLLLDVTGNGCGNSYWVDFNCNYSGTWTDVLGQAYTPLTNNIMSYGRKSCQNSMTTSQYNRANYSAINDRGYLSCLTAYGCMDTLACNYHSLATIDDGSCLDLLGCTSPWACNYDALANCEDGSCLYGTNGCTDSTAINYDSTATCNDGSCQYTTEIQEHSTNKKTLKVIDVLGRETKQTNQPLFYIYNDGTVEKKLVIEQ